MITGYGHFVQLAASLQWDEKAIDLSADREAWPMLTDAENARLLGLIAGFVVAETAVAGNLHSYKAAAPDDSMEATFRAQARDEARHARFFDRVASVVAGVPRATRSWCRARTSRSGPVRRRQPRRRRGPGMCARGRRPCAVAWSSARHRAGAPRRVVSGPGARPARRTDGLPRPAR